MTRMINVLVLAAGDAAVRTERIDGDDYRELSRLLEGDLGTCSLPPSLRNRSYYAFCDDNGFVRSDRPAANRWAVHLGHFRLVGPVVIVRTDAEGETMGLRQRDLQWLEMYFAQEPSWEAQRAAAYERDWLERNPSGVEIRVISDPSELWQ